MNLSHHSSTHSSFQPMQPIHPIQPSSPKDAETIEASRLRKIVAFDLDGTLTESKQPLRPEMGILLAKLLKKYHVAVISGGSIEQFNKQFLPFLPSAFPDSDVLSHPHARSLFLLPVSGSQRYEHDSASGAWTETDKVEFSKEIKEKTMKVLGEFEAGQGHAYGIVGNSFGPRIEERGTQITFSALGQDAPLDLKTAWDPDLQKRRDIRQYLEGILPEVDVHIGGSTSIDILPKGFTKAVGLKRLLSKMELADADAVFIGDAVYEGGNDYSVFEAGILTVAVKDSKETADFIESLL